MTVTQKGVQAFFKLNPHLAKRSMKYVAIGKLAGITPEQAQLAINANRRIQQVLPNNEKGITFEREWRAKEGMASIHELADYSDEPDVLTEAHRRALLYEAKENLKESRLFSLRPINQ